MGVNITDSLELEIIEDPLNDAFIAYDEAERKKQIDAFTTMMREKSTLEGSVVNPKPTLKPKQGQAEGTEQSTSKDHDQVDDWEKKFALEEDRFLTVTKFRSKCKVHIRDYYRNQQGVLKPSKRGIALTPMQWRKMKNLIVNIDQALQSQGV